MTQHVGGWQRGARPPANSRAAATLCARRTGMGSARTAWTLGLLVAAAMGGAYLLQRLGRRWGSTDAEVREPLPGDELVADPMVQTTHAITIAAPPGEVWPWLVQMGYGRAGWYTNDWWYRLIDRYLFHVNMPRVDRILPEWQQLAQGDVIPDGPPGTAYFTVVSMEPTRALVLYSTTHGTVWLPQALRDNPALGVHAELGWVFVLRESAPSMTRLLLRTRVSGGPALYRAFARAFLPPADFFVARMLLRTVKRNVERAAAAASAGLRNRNAAHRVAAPLSDEAEVAL